LQKKWTNCVGIEIEPSAGDLMERAVSFIRKGENYRSGKRKVSCITGGLFEKLKVAFDRKKEQSGRRPRESVQDKDHPMERK
jgi:hypothetical protein